MFKRFLLAAAVALLAVPASAQVSSSHSVSVKLPEVKLFAVDQTTVELNFAAPTTAGAGFADATATSSYSISVNRAFDKDATGPTGLYKITAYSNGAFGDGITVKALLATPSASGGGTPTTTAQTLPTDAANAVTLVSDIGKVNGQNRQISYTASATMEADNGTYTKTVTYTLTDQ